MGSFRTKGPLIVIEQGPGSNVRTRAPSATLHPNRRYTTSNSGEAKVESQNIIKDKSAMLGLAARLEVAKTGTSLLSKFPNIGFKFRGDPDMNQVI